jgi:hypothetical protein
MLLQFHRIVQDAAYLHNVGFGHAVEQKMARIADSVPAPAGSLAAMKEMIRSAMLGDFRPLNAAGKVWICRDFLDRRLDEFSVALEGLRAEVFFCPGKDARDVTSCLRSDNDFHFSITIASGLRHHLDFDVLEKPI